MTAPSNAQLQLLSRFSSVVYESPDTPEQARVARALFELGLLDRKMAQRWSYRRTATGSAAIGAGVRAPRGAS